MHLYLFNLDGETPFRRQPLEDTLYNLSADTQIGQRAGAAAQGGTRLIWNVIKKAIGAMIVFTGALASAPTCAVEKIWRRSSSKEIILKQPSA